MRAVLRFGNALLAAALALAPAAALAQAAPAPSSPPPSDAIGPGSLQNFSISGTVTRPADQPAQPAAKKAQVPAPTKQEPALARQRSPERVAAAHAQVPARTASTRPVPTPRQAEGRSAGPVATRVPSPVGPKIDTASAAGPVSTATAAPETPSFAPAPQSPAQPKGHSFLLLPWLLVALALGAGGAILFWRNRVRQALPAGPVFDLISAPESTAAPRPAQDGSSPPPATPQSRAPEPLFDLLVAKPAPEAPQSAKSPPPLVDRAEPGPVAAGVVAEAPARAPAATTHVVSTGLRPWVEIGFQPLRCILEDQQIRIEFEIELFNSGSSPARAVLVEATIVNAGPAQDEQIGAFFANPPGPGERLLVIPPLKRVTINNMVAAPTDQLHVYELGGRQLFIPLIAFKAHYRWSGGDGQTAVSYLLGRDTKGDKLAPFRRDLGPRIFRNLASRPLPIGVRK